MLKDFERSLEDTILMLIVDTIKGKAIQLMDVLP